MKMTLSAIAFALLLTGFSETHAQGQPATIFGNFDCGRWFKAPDAKTWLLGFLSGVSAMTPAHIGDPLSKLGSVDQAYLWMDNYCRKNPLNSIDRGAAALMLELKAKR